MQNAFINICLTAISVSLLKMLIPNNSFNKQINFLITCFFISTIVFIISNQKIDFFSFTISDDSGRSYVDFSEQVNDDRKNEIAEELSQRIKTVLEEENIYVKKIFINVNISGVYSISINEIKLVLSADDDFQKATETVEREVGSTVKISIEVE